ncbi:MAG: metalloregulator ArsR/SmtB family transcription factor [Thermoanaerobaculia bacterium]
MVEQIQSSLDTTFHALAHETRRALLERLGEGPATISELAEPFTVTFFAISKHLRVLEEAALVERRIVGREHRFELRPAPAEEAADWLRRQTEFWNRSLDRLERMLASRREADKEKE